MREVWDADVVFVETEKGEGVRLHNELGALGPTGVIQHMRSPLKV